MKSSMTFIRGNRCIDREKDIFFENGGEVKRLKECVLALRDLKCTFVYYFYVQQNAYQSMKTGNILLVELENVQVD